MCSDVCRCPPSVWVWLDLAHVGQLRPDYNQSSATGLDFSPWHPSCPIAWISVLGIPFVPSATQA